MGQMLMDWQGSNFDMKVALKGLPLRGASYWWQEAGLPGSESQAFDCTH
jgi:hypothetical protein